MRTATFIFLMLFTAAPGFSQYAGQPATNMAGVGPQNANNAAISMLSSSIDKERRDRYLSDEFVGSPYTDNNFKLGTLYYNDEKQGEIYYRYNAYNEEIEVKQTKLEKEVIQGLSTNKSVRLKKENGNFISFKTFVDKNDNTLNGYLTLLHDGETFDLYERIKVKFTEAQKAQNSFVKATPNRFTQFTEYYLHKKGVNRIDEVNLKNRKFIKMVNPQKRSQLKEYLKENDLNIKEEADLIEAVKFLNQISN